MTRITTRMTRTRLFLLQLACSRVGREESQQRHRETSREHAGRASRRRKRLLSWRRRRRRGSRGVRARQRVALRPSRRHQYQPLLLLLLLLRRSRVCRHDPTCSEAGGAICSPPFVKEQSCGRLTPCPRRQARAVAARRRSSRRSPARRRRRLRDPSVTPSRTRWRRDASTSSSRRRTRTKRTRTTTGTRPELRQRAEVQSRTARCLPPSSGKGRAQSIAADSFARVRVPAPGSLDEERLQLNPKYLNATSVL